MLGHDAPYTRQPYFFTDQYDLGMEYVGNVGPDGYDEVVIRGEQETGRSFAAFYLKDGVVIAVDAVNRAPEFMMGKRLISDRRALNPQRLADETVSMKELLT